MSTPGRSIVARLAAIGVFVFAAVMLVSGILKILDPSLASFFLHRATGGAVRLEFARIGVHGVSLIQAAVGASLLAWPRGTLPRRAGIGLGFVLASTELLSVWFDWGGQCGCFGAWEPPPWLGGSVVLLGIVSLAVRRQRARRYGGLRVMVTVISALGLLLAVALSDIVRVISADVRSPTALLESLDGAGPEDLVIVGSGTCAHCCELLARYATRSAQDVVFVVSEEDSDPGCLGEHSEWLSRIAIPDLQWWSLVEEEAPTLYRWDDAAWEWRCVDR